MADNVYPLLAPPSRVQLNELRELASALLDCIVLDHAMTRDDWERLCMLTGRYCDPFLPVDPNMVFLSTREPS